MTTKVGTGDEDPPESEMSQSNVNITPNKQETNDNIL